MAIERIHLGCPVWGRKDWVGELFRAGTPQARYLEEYGKVFNAVEGNTTFYATPSPEIVARWGDQTPPSFRFCFKLPKTVTHDRQLVNARREAEGFIARMAPLGSRLGPFMIQLPPHFGPSQLPTLEDFLVGLPRDFRYAVEVRHPALFGGAACEELDAVLREQGVDRVVLDTRGLHGRGPIDPHHAASQAKKPKLPLHVAVTGTQPLVRFIGDPEEGANEGLLWGWAKRVAQWIDDGLRPYVFMHCPNDFFAPRLARHFVSMVGQRTA
ncbi:MAG: DUF72 domain-containing protein, partial [Myxococcota bacterium]